MIAGNRYIIVKPIYDNEILEISGVKLFNSSTFDSKQNGVTHGHVVYAPDWTGVEEGDILFFYYNVVQPDQNMGDYYLADKEEDLWAVPVFQGTAEKNYMDSNLQAYFAIRGEEIISIGPWNLVEPIMESDPIKKVQTNEGTVDLWVKPNPERMAQLGNLVVMGDREAGYEALQPGRIYFNLQSEIPITLDGKEYYRIRTGNILACEIDGEFVPMGPWAFVDPDPVQKELPSGLILPISIERQRSGAHTGTVKESGPGSILKSGEKVYFDRASGGVEINNQLLHACHSDTNSYDIFGYFG